MIYQIKTRGREKNKHKNGEKERENDKNEKKTKQNERSGLLRSADTSHPFLSEALAVQTTFNSQTGESKERW